MKMNEHITCEQINDINKTNYTSNYWLTVAVLQMQ